MMIHGKRYEYPPIFVARIHERGRLFTTERWKSHGAQLVDVAVNETSYSAALSQMRDYIQELPPGTYTVPEFVELPNPAREG